MIKVFAESAFQCPYVYYVPALKWIDFKRCIFISDAGPAFSHKKFWEMF